MTAPRRYAAFISYSHADTHWAKWLQKQLESFRVPRRLVGTAGEYGPVPARLAPVFRDREELASANDLGGRITQALDASDALVVICSPAAAASPWVNEEIRSYRRLGRSDRIHCLLVPAEPGGRAGPLFPPALVEVIDPEEAAPEPIAADLSESGDGPALARQKLIAGLLGLGLDDLRQREAQRRQRRLAWITTASVAGMAVAAVLAGQAHVARNDALRRQAQAEDLLGFMIDDLRPKLERVGRLDLLDAVGDKALDYFDSLPSRDQTDTALSQQARALTQIGQVRLDQGEHAQALAAFSAAHARALELSRRAPDDGGRLFDLAQAEYWIGLVAWRQRDLDTAETWLRSYRDRSEALAALDPTRFDWQREVAYGHHNLAVLDDSRGRHAEAAAAFESELALYRAWLPGHPDDTLLRFEAANVASWLGAVNERLGRLAQSEAYFLEADQGHAANQAQEPKVMAWTDNRIDTSVQLAKVRMRQGKLAEAREGLRDAVVAASALSRHDPENTAWRRSHGNTLLSLASVEKACGDTQAAEAAVAEAREVLAQALAEAPEDNLAITYFARAALIDAELALLADRSGDAAAALAQADEPLSKAWQREPSDTLRQLSARHDQLQASLLERRGDTGAASALRRQALARLLDAGAGEPAFGHLESLVSIQRELGEFDAAEANLGRLRQAGGVFDAPPAACAIPSAGSPAATRTAP
ncbi:toll/interleukin-1 receptor domain-containing protein [Arenimonas aestuarii]